MNAERLTPLFVGPCPTEWKQPFIEEITDLLTNGFVGPSLPHQTENCETGICYLQGFNVRPNKLDLARTTWVTHDFHAKNRKSQLREGDVLVVQSGHIGTAAVVPKEAAGSNCHAVIICRFNSSIVDPDFASQYLNSQIGQVRLRGLHVGSSLPHINTSELGRFRLPLPPLKEQTKLAQLWVTWDTAIQKIEQLIAAKEKHYKSLSHRLLFGLVRIGNSSFRRTKKLHWFAVSSDWPIVEIGQIASEVSAVKATPEELPVLSCTKYDGLVDSLEYFDKQVFSHDTSKYKLVRRGQFAYATNHIEEGSIGYQDLVPAGLVSPIYTVFRTDTSRVNDGYLYKLLKTEKLRQLFAANTNASVDRRGSLRWSEFARIQIPLPPVEEQRSINQLLDEAKRAISLLRAQVQALKIQKRGLMQKLLTGHWRLPTRCEETA